MILKRWEKEIRLMIPLVIILTLLQIVGTKWNSSFWWQGDAPCHAMNGVFVRDLIVNHPFSDLKGYAERYYAKYPALTILYYPPLFYIVEAIFFFVFGVSEVTARLAVFFFFLFGSVGFYLLARTWSKSELFAFVCTLVLFLSPGVIFWSRDIMLDIPLLALIIWTSYFFLKYMETERKVYCFLTVFFFVLSMYTKQNAIFLLPLFVCYVFLIRKGRLLRTRHFWVAVSLGVLLLIPFSIIFLKFQKFNLLQTISSYKGKGSLENLWYYIAHLPKISGWVPFIFLSISVVYLAIYGFRRGMHLFNFVQLSFPVLWMAVYFVFFSLLTFSLLTVRESRHFLAFLPGFALFSTWILWTLPINRVAKTGLLSILLFANGYYDIKYPVPFVDGIEEACNYVLKNQKGGTLLISSHHDGDFIFTCRKYASKKKMIILRASKILYSCAIYAGRSYSEHVSSLQQLDSIFARYAIQQVVVEEPFTRGSSLKPLRLLEDYIRSGGLVFKAEFTIEKYISPGKIRHFKFMIYENPHFDETALGDTLEIPLPIIRRTFKIPLREILH